MSTRYTAHDDGRVRKGDRFRAFPGRQVRVHGGEWITDPIYEVTRVRHTAVEVVYYRVAGTGTTSDYATLPYLKNNGMEIVK
jgi:hypothetical protein